MLNPLMDYQLSYQDEEARFALDFEHRSVHPPQRFTPGEAPALHNPHLDQLGHITGVLSEEGARVNALMRWEYEGRVAWGEDQDRWRVDHFTTMLAALRATG